MMDLGSVVATLMVPFAALGAGLWLLLVTRRDDRLHRGRRLSGAQKRHFTSPAE